MLQIKAGGEGIAQYEKDALDNFIKDLMKPDGPDGAFTAGKEARIDGPSVHDCFFGTDDHSL